LRKKAFLLCLLLFFVPGVIDAKPVKSQPKKVKQAATSTKKYYEGAIKFHKAGDYKNAVAWYNAALKTDRKFWQAWLGLGICYYNMKKYSNARLIFKYVISLKPGEPTAKKYYEMMGGKQDAGIEKKRERKQKGDMMWRSALLPGLGQFYNDELAKGYLYTFSYLACAAAIIKYTIDQQAAVDAYRNATTGFDAKYKTAEEAGTKVIVPVAAAGVVLAVSVLDAFLSGTDAPVYFKKAEFRIMDGNTLAMNLVSCRF
jgi:tetratricopeptide (TPR) repeat protein